MPTEDAPTDELRVKIEEVTRTLADLGVRLVDPGPRIAALEQNVRLLEAQLTKLGGANVRTWARPGVRREPLRRGEGTAQRAVKASPPKRVALVRQEADANPPDDLNRLSEDLQAMVEALGKPRAARGLPPVRMLGESEEVWRKRTEEQ